MTNSSINTLAVDHSPMTSSPAAALEATLETLRTKRYTLLVVDDQPINIQVLYNILSADYAVYMATNGEQALKVCAAQKPDLIVLDVEMPGLNGFDICLRLKGDAETRNVPVIFVTAHSDEVSETRGLEVGAVDFIYKPINPNIVRARIKTHLTLKAQADLLRDWVYIDSLININNRRYFDERLGTEWSRATRNNTELGLLLIDVDFFKRYNDYYGHPAGDECLRKVAGAMKDALKRPTDVVARYGGEEFTCLLPDTNQEGALHLAETIRKAIIALNIAHAASTIIPWVTVSIGVCVKPANFQGDAATLLRMADLQLYNAKEHGRNRVCSVVL